jgi:hypothetical protein
MNVEMRSGNCEEIVWIGSSVDLLVFYWQQLAVVFVAMAVSVAYHDVKTKFKADLYDVLKINRLP